MFYVALAFILNINNRLHDYIGLKTYPEIKARVITHATETVFLREHTFFQDEFSGTIAGKIKEFSRGVNDVIRMIVERALYFLLTLSIASFTMMSIHPFIPYIVIVYALLIISLSLFYSKKIQSLSKLLSQSNSKVTGVLVDCFLNILNVRLFNAFNKEKKELLKNLDDTIAKERNLRVFILKMMGFQGIITGLMMGVTLFILAQSHRTTVGDFGLILTMLISISNIILSFSHDVSNFSESLGLVSQGLELLKSNTAQNNCKETENLLVSSGKIQFDRVYFKYASSINLFQDISITIEGQQKVGLVGHTGSGKSTFLRLILRLFDLDSGKIMIDGQDILLIPQDTLYNVISVVPQETSLFHRSIFENIQYGKPNASDEEIISAAKKAHVHDFIMKLPQKYETTIGERGVKLSGGERQQIGIARAILKNSPILLLDEATSSMDSNTESHIQESLQLLMQGKTVITIAHRISTLLLMDRILVFHQGNVLEDGSHNVLLKKNGIYCKYWMSQNLSNNFSVSSQNLTERTLNERRLVEEL